MRDIQMEGPEYQIGIDWVGICDFSFPVMICDVKQIAKINLATSLDAEHRGTHMSRLINALHEKEAVLSKSWLLDLGERMKNLLGASNAKIGLEYLYLLEKKSPISEMSSYMKYYIYMEYQDIKGDRKFIYDLKIPVMTVCPCSKAISKQGAHNQRAIIQLKIMSHEYLDLLNIIKKVEKCASSELWSLLKRPDEKFVTESSYNNPKFVEDVSRDVACVLDKDKIGPYEVCVTSYESIHTHNAYSYIKSIGVNEI